jgi:hypothetical protein
MKNNKHILLFEAFASNTLLKTIAFLDKEVGKRQRVEFLNNFKSFIEGYDIPLDKIDDSCFDYLGKKDALDLRNTEPVKNEDGIYCFKFWFSTDRGYLGYTYTGNTIKKKNTSRGTSDRYQIKFEDLESVGIKSGTVKKLNSVSDLKTGDIIYGIFSSEINNEFKKATIFKCEGSIYAIQDGSSGSNPGCRREEWSMYGRHSWHIGYSRRGTMDDDNHKICVHIDDGSELNIDGVRKGSTTSNIIIENPMEFNLPMNGKSVRSWWGDSFNSIGDDGVKVADFAIILYYDKLKELDLKSPAKLRSEREESRKDAYALLKNEEIKKANIARYMDQICDGLGLNYNNELNPRNLQKLVLKILNGNLAIMNIGYRSANTKIQRLINDIAYLMDEYKSSGKPLSGRQNKWVEERYRNLITRIKDYYNDTNLTGDQERSKKLIVRLEKEGKTEELEIYKKLLNIGNYISTSSLRDPINTVDDLRLMEIKIATIYNVMNHDHLRLTSYVRNAMDSLRSDEDDAFYYLNSIKDNEGHDEANRKLDLLDRYVKSIL